MKQKFKTRIKALVASFALATGAVSTAKAQEPPEASAAGAALTGMLMPTTPEVAAIRVDKSDRLMELLDNRGDVVKRYKIGLGKNPVGDKIMRGDARTPEGTYFIQSHKPDSAYTLSLRISYPNAQDRAEAQALGVSPGGDIFIHGQPTGTSDQWRHKRGDDWTLGCIAVKNNDIREIYALVKPGTPITIRP